MYNPPVSALIVVMTGGQCSGHWSVVLAAAVALAVAAVAVVVSGGQWWWRWCGLVLAVD